MAHTVLPFEPEAIVFSGYGSQYDHKPLGTLPTAFHRCLA
jgi:hypothetical protein